MFVTVKALVESYDIIIEQIGLFVSIRFEFNMSSNNVLDGLNCGLL